MANSIDHVYRREILDDFGARAHTTTRAELSGRAAAHAQPKVPAPLDQRQSHARSAERADRPIAAEARREREAAAA